LTELSTIIKNVIIKYYLNRYPQNTRASSENPMEFMIIQEVYYILYSRGQHTCSIKGHMANILGLPA
jgi:hypothetical protein